MMTEYNPNYVFAGGSCTIEDLREVDRENLFLVKYEIKMCQMHLFDQNVDYVDIWCWMCTFQRALGQGAFGEVYQGILKSKSDSAEVNVAVKTLPELSTNQG